MFPDISHYIGQTLDGVKINDSDDFAMYLFRKKHMWRQWAVFLSEIKIVSVFLRGFRRAAGRGNEKNKRIIE